MLEEYVAIGSDEDEVEYAQILDIKDANRMKVRWLYQSQHVTLNLANSKNKKVEENPHKLYWSDHTDKDIPTSSILYHIYVYKKVWPAGLNPERVLEWESSILTKAQKKEKTPDGMITTFYCTEFYDPQEERLYPLTG
mmetsp:Transcript_50632/g.77022  ORF Transcript_50632/g.77022 Transcript_50632/m.77022 type:complete len:138 (+) Transcript_50632:85-498(+)